MSTTTKPGPVNAPGRPAAAPEAPAAVVAPAAPAAPTAPVRTRRRVWPLFLVFVVVAAGSAAGAWYYYAHQPRDESQLVLYGNIDVRQVNLAFKVDGRIETLAVDEGDTVRASDVIATLDKRYFQDDLAAARARRDNLAAVLARLEHGSRPEEIAQARAQLAQQDANLALAKGNMRRGEELAPSGAISKEELEVRRQAVEVGEANLRYAQQTLRLAEIGPRQEDIDAARAQLNSEETAVIVAQRRLADADLIAPGAGTILTRAREKGAIVQAGETVFTLTLASPVWVRTYVNERDLGRITPDMAAEVHTDSAPGKVYPARIGFISPTAEFTPKTVETRELRTDLVYRLRVVVPNPDGGLRQGMPVTVTLLLDRGA
jgi:HlyD family secretion protein